jgi:hypothetical protein
VPETWHKDCFIKTANNGILFVLGASLAPSLKASELLDLCSEQQGKIAS